MTEPADSPTDLQTRQDLPDALKALLREYPRDNWETHPNFNGLVRFWLDRHMMFRRILATLTEEATQRLDGNIDPQQYLSNLSRLGSMFVGELHGHHNIEDMHYFPILAQKDHRISIGFDILETDHHALDAVLNNYVEDANAALRASDASNDETGKLLETTQDLGRLLHRHLLDEEDLVVPVILKHGAGGLG